MSFLLHYLILTKVLPINATMIISAFILTFTNFIIAILILVFDPFAGFTNLTMVI